MTADETPRAQVIPQYTRDIAEKHLKAFIGEDGQWDRLVRAKNALIKTLEPRLEEAAGSYHGFSRLRLADFLIGSYGLKGEFANPLETWFNHALVRHCERTLDKRLGDVVEAWGEPSQLSESIRKRWESALMTVELVGKKPENKGQALHRCASQIRRWMRQEDMGEPERKQLKKALTEYCAALRDVEVFVGYAGEYIKHAPGTKLRDPEGACIAPGGG